MTKDNKAQEINNSIVVEEVEYVAQTLRDVLSNNLIGQGNLVLAEEIARKQFQDDHEFMQSIFYQKIKEHLESKGIDTSNLEIKLKDFQISYGEPGKWATKKTKTYT